MQVPLADRFMIRRMRRAIDSAARREEHSSRIPLMKAGKLKLLFAGYTGAYNMGADVRVEEMIRQFRHLLGAERFEASVFSFAENQQGEYFQGAELLQPKVDFPSYLSKLVPNFDGVVACEGSLFKSQFTDLLPAMMIGALGLASATGRLSVAYGAEAGEMSTELSQLARDYCGQSYLIARSQRACNVLSALELEPHLGTDTAWTFEPHPPEIGERELRKQGWKGEPILTVCPINPFWWPVNISLAKTLAWAFGFYRDSHYGRVFFHRSGPEINRRFEAYLRSLADTVSRFCRKRNYFPVIAGCERVDRIAVEKLSKMLRGTARFVSSDYEPRTFVSILRCSELMLSSRYHAVVTTMPAGVVSAGLSMDERLDTLLEERGHPDLLVRIREANPGERLEGMLDHMHNNREKLRAEIEFDVCRHLQRMSQMGRLIVEHIQSRYPEFNNLPQRKSWDQYLPRMSHGLEDVLSRHVLQKIGDEDIRIAAGNSTANGIEEAGESNYATRWSGA